MATESDNVNTAALSTIIIVGAIAMVAIVAAITALVRSSEGDQRNKVNSAADLGTYRELVASQRALLTAPPGWVNKDKGLVSIPIDRAMVDVVKNIRQNPYAATPGLPDAGAQPEASTTGTEAGAAAQADAGGTAQSDAGAAPPANKGAAQKSGSTMAPHKHKAASPSLTTPHRHQAAPSPTAKHSAAPKPSPAKAPTTGQVP